MHKRHARSNWECCVRYATDNVEFGISKATPHCFGNTMQDVGVRNDDTKINVNRGNQATLQLKLAKFDGLK